MVEKKEEKNNGKRMRVENIIEGKRKRSKWDDDDEGENCEAIRIETLKTSQPLPPPTSELFNITPVSRLAQNIRQPPIKRPTVGHTMKPKVNWKCVCDYVKNGSGRDETIRIYFDGCSNGCLDPENIEMIKKFNRKRNGMTKLLKVTIGNDLGRSKSVNLNGVTGLRDLIIFGNDIKKITVPQQIKSLVLCVGVNKVEGINNHKMIAQLFLRCVDFKLVCAQGMFKLWTLPMLESLNIKECKNHSEIDFKKLTQLSDLKCEEIFSSKTGDGILFEKSKANGKVVCKMCGHYSQPINIPRRPFFKMRTLTITGSNSQPVDLGLLNSFPNLKGLKIIGSTIKSSEDICLQNLIKLELIECRGLSFKKMKFPMLAYLDIQKMKTFTCDFPNKMKVPMKIKLRAESIVCKNVIEFSLNMTHN